MGRGVGKAVSYRAGQSQHTVTIRRCLVPGEPRLRAQKAASQAVRFLAGDHEEDEASKVAFALLETIKSGISPAEIVLTWRAPFQSGPFEMVLADGGIPYRMEGACGFFDQPVGRGILALLRLLANPADRDALFEAMRTFSQVPAEELEALAADWRGPENQAPDSTTAMDAGAADVLRVLRDLWLEADRLNPCEALSACGRGLAHLRPDLIRDGFHTPWPVILRAARGHRRIRSFLARVDENAGRSRRGARDGVMLLPLPLLGERKFAALFLIGANEGSLPLPAEEVQDTLAAERELFYGALSAARQVTVSWARTIGGAEARPSRFVAEVTTPDDAL